VPSKPPHDSLEHGLEVEVLLALPAIKKGKSGKRGSAAKGKGAPKSIDEYLAGVPERAHSTLNKVRAAIRSGAPREATEIISYGVPAFKHKGVLVWFAAGTP